MTVSDSFGKMYKEVVVTCFKVLSQHLLGRTEETYKSTSIRIDGLLLENQNQNLPNIK
jgi:hypothetical protein